MSSPRTLVRQYAVEANPLERRGNGGPEQLPAGKAILALDDAGRAEAVVAAYALLPHGPRRRRTYGEHIMLGLLITTLLRKRLPLKPADLEVMAEGAARAHGPAWGPCDHDLALVKELERHERLSPRVKTALRALAKRRGERYAEDRRVTARCRKLAEDM